MEKINDFFGGKKKVKSKPVKSKPVKPKPKKVKKVVKK